MFTGFRIPNHGIPEVLESRFQWSRCYGTLGLLECPESEDPIIQDSVKSKTPEIWHLALQVYSFYHGGVLLVDYQELRTPSLVHTQIRFKFISPDVTQPISAVELSRVGSALGNHLVYSLNEAASDGMSLNLLSQTDIVRLAADLNLNMIDYSRHNRVNR